MSPQPCLATASILLHFTPREDPIITPSISTLSPSLHTLLLCECLHCGKLLHLLSSTGTRPCALRSWGSRSRPFLQASHSVSSGLGGHLLPVHHLKALLSSLQLILGRSCRFFTAKSCRLPLPAVICHPCTATEPLRPFSSPLKAEKMSHQDWDRVVIRPAKGSAAAASVAARAAAGGAGGVSEKKHAPAVTAAGFSTTKLEADTEHFGSPVAAPSRDFTLALQQARAAKTWKQKELATAISEPASLVGDWEAGRAVPTPAVISKLERALGVKLPRPAKKA